MLKKLLTSTGLVAVIHFIVVVLYANGIGGNVVSKTFEVIGQPGAYVARELGFGGFGLLDGIAGNEIGLWIVMVLNSLLWGLVIGAVFSKIKA